MWDTPQLSSVDCWPKRRWILRVQIRWRCRNSRTYRTSRQQPALNLRWRWCSCRIPTLYCLYCTWKTYLWKPEKWRIGSKNANCLSQTFSRNVLYFSRLMFATFLIISFIFLLVYYRRYKTLHAQINNSYLFLSRPKRKRKGWGTFWSHFGQRRDPYKTRNLPIFWFSKFMQDLIQNFILSCLVSIFNWSDDVWYITKSKYYLWFLIIEVVI